MENLEKLRNRSTQRIKPVINIGILARVINLLRTYLITFGTVAAFFTGWELLARAGLLSGLIFPLPSVIFSKLYEGLTEGDYFEHLIITVTRLISGFFFGAGSGLLLGMLMGWSQRVRQIVDPLISAIHPIPKFAILPVIIIAFGIGETSRIILISIGSFFPMLINTIGGVLQINPIYYEAIDINESNKLEIFMTSAFP